MNGKTDGRAIVYCEGSFNMTNGKTAHGLVRYTERYEVAGVIDSRYAGSDSGSVLDGKANGIPIFKDLTEAVDFSLGGVTPGDNFIIGLTPDGGRLPPEAKNEVKAAISMGLNVVCGLHDRLSEDPELSVLAADRSVTITDVRKPPPLDDLHFFTGKIEEVTSLKVAVLGSDSAVGKRTTSMALFRDLKKRGITTEIVGTGQTSWMQGVGYSVIFDSLINDFVSGEIEHVVWNAWKEKNPQVIIIEGQGSLMNPAYPSGLEILAASRPDLVVFQHSHTREEYDGFPGYPIEPINRQLQAIEVLSGVAVVAITLNHEGLRPEDVPGVSDCMRRTTGIPVFDVLRDGSDGLIDVLIPFIKKRGGSGES